MKFGISLIVLARFVKPVITQVSNCQSIQKAKEAPGLYDIARPPSSRNKSSTKHKTDPRTGWARRSLAVETRGPWGKK